MKARIAIAVGICLALAVPVIAQASLPSTNNTLIVPNKSVGGIGFGATPKEVVKAWGHAETTPCVGSCNYPGKNEGEQITVGFETKDNGKTYKAWSIFLNAGRKDVGGKSVPICPTPLGRFETSKGIHLCSTVGELKAAYPKVKKLPPYSYALGGPRETATYFTVVEGTKISGISVVAHPGG